MLGTESAIVRIGTTLVEGPRRSRREMSPGEKSVCGDDRKLREMRALGSGCPRDVVGGAGWDQLIQAWVANWVSIWFASWSGDCGGHSSQS